jgi:hypothetical protein
VDGSHIGISVTQPCGNCCLADAGATCDPKQLGRRRIGQPISDPVEQPLPTAETSQMRENVRFEWQRLQELREPHIGALELGPLTSQRLVQCFELRLVLLDLVYERHAVTHVEPLDTTDRQWRLTPDKHHRDDAQPPAHSACDFIEAIPVRTAHGMRSHDEHNPTFRGHRRRPFDAFLDVRLPIRSWLEAVNVEPDLVAAADQVLLQTQGQRNVLVVTVAQEDACHREASLRDASLSDAELQPACVRYPTAAAAMARATAP